MKLSETISSATAKVDDKVNFEVLEDVKFGDDSLHTYDGRLFCHFCH